LVYRIPAGMSVSEAISLVGGRFFPEVTWVTHVYPYNPYYVYFRESCYTDPGEPWYWLSAEDPNYDGRTNILDLVFIRNRTGQDPSSGDNWQADLNHDGEINIRDMIRAFNHFNEDWRDWAWEAITGESGLPGFCDDSLTN
jgi:hypothetical protein